MYMTFRLMESDLARTPDAVALAARARDHMNSQFGTDFRVSVNVGGDPSAISLTCAWEKLGQYDKVRQAVAADPVMQSLMRTGGGMLRSVQDTIGQILKAPGERRVYASVSMAQMHMPAVSDAIPFALEVAEFAGQKTNREVGVMAAKTGNRSGIMWVSFADDLDEMMEQSQALETDPDWLQFFKRSEGLYVPGSLEDSIWQMVP